MTTSTPTGIPGPADGDVLIARDKDHKHAYTLSVMPGPPQMPCPTYEKAVSTAVVWASRRRVAIWSTQDGQIFTAVSPTGKSAAAHRVNKAYQTP